jgi:endonuclease YncB( thermonuclease family)
MLVGAGGGGVLSSIPGFATYNTANDIPNRLFEARTTIVGTVASVTDGDTIRVTHEPLLGSLLRKRGGARGKLTETAIAVRLYGVDAPEVSERRTHASAATRHACAAQ